MTYQVQFLRGLKAHGFLEIAMDKFDILLHSLTDQRKKLKRALESAKKTRDSAPSAMESHHDTIRNQTEKLVVALLEQLHELDKQIATVPKASDSISKNIELWSLVNLKTGDSTLKIMLVTDGLGGKEFEGIKFVSTSTPIGGKLMGKTVGDKISLNEKEFLIEVLE